MEISRNSTPGPAKIDFMHQIPIIEALDFHRYKKSITYSVVLKYETKKYIKSKVVKVVVAPIRAKRPKQEFIERRDDILEFIGYVLTKTCRNCNKQLKWTEKFCGNCGSQAPI